LITAQVQLRYYYSDDTANGFLCFISFNLSDSFFSTRFFLLVLRLQQYFYKFIFVFYFCFIFVFFCFYFCFIFVFVLTNP